MRRHKQHVGRAGQQLGREAGMRPQAWERHAPQREVRAKWRQRSRHLVAVERVAALAVAPRQRRQQLIGVVLGAGARRDGDPAGVDTDVQGSFHPT
jgi:hypothetical protein